MVDRRRIAIYFCMPSQVPLISLGGGMVVDPSIGLNCAYGDDGSTYRAPGGCYNRWCDRRNPFPNNWNGAPPCGFGGNSQVQAAWRPADLDKMLALYNEHSQVAAHIALDGHRLPF